MEETHDSDSDSSADMNFGIMEFNDLNFGSPFAPSSNNADSSTPASGGASGSSSTGPRRSQRFRSTLNPRHGRRRLVEKV